MTKFLLNEFPNFKPIKAFPDKILPLVESKMVEIETEMNNANGEQKDKLQKNLNYLLNLKNHCEKEPQKAVFFTKDQASLIQL